MTDQLSTIEHIVVLMLENRSLDHMLGFLYAAQGNVSPAGQPYEGLTGKESNPAASGTEVAVFPIAANGANTYFMPGADPGEGFQATNSQLFGSDAAPAPPLATKRGFVTNFADTLGWEATLTALTLSTARTDDPLQGMTAPVAPVPGALETPPSHLERVHADLAAQLPLQGRPYSAAPVFATSADIKFYIDARVAAWEASRQPG